MTTVFDSTAESCLLEDLNSICSIDEYVTTNGNFSQTFNSNYLNDFFQSEEASLYYYESSFNKSSAISSLISFYGSEQENSHSSIAESKSLNRVLTSNSATSFQYMNKDNLLKNKPHTNESVLLTTPEKLPINHLELKKKTKYRASQDSMLIEKDSLLVRNNDLSKSFQAKEISQVSHFPSVSCSKLDEDFLHDKQKSASNNQMRASSPILLLLTSKDSPIDEFASIPSTPEKEEKKKDKFNSLTKKKLLPSVVTSDTEANGLKVSKEKNTYNTYNSAKRNKKLSTKLQQIEPTENSVIPSEFKSKSELVAYVEQKLESMEESFTFKSATYQLHLKKFLPKPDDKHRKYIEKIQCFPKIPASYLEKRELLSLRQVKKGMNPESRLGDGDGLTIKERLDEMLTSLVNKIMFLLVVQFGTWYIHAPAREQIREQLLEFIWPSLPDLQASFREHFTAFIDMRIRHFRDSVARYFRDRPRIDTKLIQNNNSIKNNNFNNQFHTAKFSSATAGSCLLPKLPPSYQLKLENKPQQPSQNRYISIYQNYVTAPTNNGERHNTSAISQFLPIQSKEFYSNHNAYITQRKSVQSDVSTLNETSSKNTTNNFYVSQGVSKTPKYMVQNVTPFSRSSPENSYFLNKRQSYSTPNIENTIDYANGEKSRYLDLEGSPFVNVSNHNRATCEPYRVHSIKNSKIQTVRPKLLKKDASSYFYPKVSSNLPKTNLFSTSINKNNISHEISSVNRPCPYSVKSFSKAVIPFGRFSKITNDSEKLNSELMNDQLKSTIANDSEKLKTLTSNFSQSSTMNGSWSENLKLSTTRTVLNQNILTQTLPQHHRFFPHSSRPQRTSIKTLSNLQLVSPYPKLMMPCTVKASSTSSFSVSSSSGKVDTLLPMTEIAAAAYNSHYHLKKTNNPSNTTAHGLSTLATTTETLLSSSCVQSSPYAFTEQMFTSLCL